ncbi:MAG: restriction endonuclease subunit S, partial [Hafnia alvei]
AFEECSEPSLGLGGWVPEGWLETKLSELVDTVSKTYPLKTVDEVIFLNTGDIENGNFLHANYSKVDGLPGQAKKSIRKGDILFSEIRPKNKRFAYVGFESNNYVVSTKLMVLRAKDVFNPLFAYFLLTLNQTTDELQRIAELRSGTFPQITFNELSLIQFVLPSTGGIMERFVSLYLEPFFEKSSSNRQENESLVNLRDTLLPKLISGEIQLNENGAEIANAVLI